MDFKIWLNQTKIDEPELETFINKLENFFSENGFKATAFEKSVSVGLGKIDSEIEELLKPEIDVEN